MTITDASGYSPTLWTSACGHMDTTKQLLQLTHRDIPSSDDTESLASHDDSMTSSHHKEDSLPASEGGQLLRMTCAVGALDICQLLINTSNSVINSAFKLLHVTIM